MTNEAIKYVVSGYESGIDSANECVSGLKKVDYKKVCNTTKNRLNEKLAALQCEINELITILNK